MSISPLDILFIAIFLIASIRCIIRGFVAEILTFASVFGGIIASLIFHKMLGNLFNDIFGVSAWNPFIAFLVIFLVVYLIFKLLEKVLHDAVEKVELEKLDQSLGLFLGIVEGLFLIIAIIFLLKIQPFFEVGTLVEDSFFGGIITSILPENFFILPESNSV